MSLSDDVDYYALLNVSRSSSAVEIRRSYRNLLTKEHPDKGGDPEKFAQIQRAYDVLSSDERRATYDQGGAAASRTVDEEFVDAFGGGSFSQKLREQEGRREHLADQIQVRQSADANSHTAGFEAWMRARGDAANVVYTSETMAEQFGVVKSSYEAVPLPPIRAYQVRCNSLAMGGVAAAKDALEIVSEAIPSELEWGEVLVNIRAAPVNPLDLYTVATGSAMAGGKEDAPEQPPFIAGHDALAVVVKIGPGVKNLAENDWVFPFKPKMGTWRSLAVWREKDVLKMPSDLMPAEYASMMREMCVAYRLLEDYGSLRPGDAVILNAANSTVGQVVIQLCTLLKLRTIALIRENESKPEEFEKTANWLKSLGATEVLPDAGSIKLELDKKRFFAKPKLGLDAVGGQSAVRLADALHEGCPLVIYGCMSNRAPTWPWGAWVSNELSVFGFNLRRWMNQNKKKVPSMLEALAKLVNADKLVINYTEYELSTEFDEAIDHALEDGRGTKIMLKVNDIGVTY
ncbi:J domain-containing protein [Pseudoscourfieldia marina]